MPEGALARDLDLAGRSYRSARCSGGQRRFLLPRSSRRPPVVRPAQVTRRSASRQFATAAIAGCAAAAPRVVQSSRDVPLQSQDAPAQTVLGTRRGSWRGCLDRSSQRRFRQRDQCAGLIPVAPVTGSPRARQALPAMPSQSVGPSSLCADINRGLIRHCPRGSCGCGR